MSQERLIEKKENMAGGEGFVTIEHLGGPEAMDERCPLFALVTIEPGSSLGYHEHHGETETYYLLKGTAEYNDDGNLYQVKEGDVTFCKDGHGHGLKPVGNETLMFIALILRN